MIKDFTKDTWEEFEAACHNKNVVLYGAGKRCHDNIINLLKYNVTCIVDGDDDKSGQIIEGIAVYGLEKLSKINKNNTVVLITIDLVKEPEKCLNELGYENVFFFVLDE